MLARREAAVQRPFIQVSRGLLDPKHVDAIGPAVWVFLWCARFQSDNTGSVMAGAVIPERRICADLGLAPRTVREHIDRLENAGYLTVETVAGRGVRLHVNNPTAIKRPDAVHKSVGNCGQPRMHADVAPATPAEIRRGVGGFPPGSDAPTILASKALSESKSTARPASGRATPRAWEQSVARHIAEALAPYKRRLLARPKLVDEIGRALVQCRKVHHGVRPEAFGTGLRNYLKIALATEGTCPSPYSYLERAISGANEDRADAEHVTRARTAPLPEDT